jgi:hypothetical protein
MIVGMVGKIGINFFIMNYIVVEYRDKLPVRVERDANINRFKKEIDR